MASVADQTNHRRDINDPAAALFDHRADDCLSEIKDAAQIGVDNRVPIFHRHSHGKAISRHAGIIHQDVDLGEVLENLSADFLHRRMIGNVDRVMFRRIRTQTI